MVLRGEGGEGKTTLAGKPARWLVSRWRFDWAAFVSPEDHSWPMANGMTVSCAPARPEENRVIVRLAGPR